MLSVGKSRRKLGSASNHMKNQDRSKGEVQIALFPNMIIIMKNESVCLKAQFFKSFKVLNLPIGTNVFSSK